MSGKQLAKRILSVLFMTVVILVLITVIRAEATPIRPDIRTVLSQPNTSQSNFAPARAGWNGPETDRQAPNTTYAELGPQGTVRAVRESMIAAALPDYRAVAGIALVILLLRRMRNARRKALAAASVGAAPATVHVMEPSNNDTKDRAA